MNIIVIGINHKNTPIEIREKFCLSITQQDLLLSELKNNPSIVEAFVFSTCNRVEIYADVLNEHADFQTLIQYIFKIKQIPLDDSLAKYFYQYSGKEAIRHLLAVSAGIDSMVIGEKQILGQIKSAFERAREQGMFGKYFNILSNLAIRTGKKSRTETNIGVGGSSVSWAAITKAEEVLGTLQGKSILLIGAGKMSELAAEQIKRKSFGKLYLMNRTKEKAEIMAQAYGGEPVSFCDIKEILMQVDICLCAASAPHYILEKLFVQKVMNLRKNRKLVFIDISMPRNIDPTISEIPHTLLYEIDDLQEVVDSTMKIRQDAIKDVEVIIAKKITEYYRKISKSNSEFPFSYTNLE